MIGELDLDKMRMEAVLREIREYKIIRNEPFMYHNKANNSPSYLIRLPYTKKQGEERRPNVRMCVDEMMRVVGEECREDVIDQLLDCLLSGPNEEITRQKLREKRVIPKVMDEFESAAILDEASIKVWQWRTVQQCLKLFMDVEKIAVPESRMRALGADHGDIKHGVYYWPNPENPNKVREKIHYWVKVSHF